MKNVNELSHNAILYSYPDGAYDIICSPDMIFMEPGWEAHEDYGKPAQIDNNLIAKAPRQAGKKAEGDDLLRSMRRARSKLRRLALSNDFQYFVTLTLDQDKIDRYDGTKIVRTLGQWCDNMVRRNGLRYILVPEQHKDGAFHFHGFFSGEGLKVVDSGHKLAGRTVYNLPQWHYGFTTAQELYGDYHAAVAYCCKYIGKQQGQRPLGRWYYSGGDLAEPLKSYLDLDFRECGKNVDNCVEFSIPGSKIKVLHEKGGQSDEK